MNFNYKSFSQAQLDWAFEGKSFKLKPYWHQLVSLAFAVSKSRICYFHDVGTGKSYLSYLTAEMWGCERILVICPSSSVSAWVRDIKYVNYSYQVIEGETKQRKAIMQENENVFICPYPALKTVFGGLQTKKNGNRRWEVNLDSLQNSFDVVIFDEVHKCSNYSSLQTRICFELSKRSKFTIGLTGTPVDRLLLELFGIFKIVDLGRSLGWSFWRFRRENFIPCGYDWRIRSGRKEKILKLIAESCICFSQEECCDLPPVREEIIYLSPTKEFRELEDCIISEEPLGLDGSSAIFKLDSLKGLKLKQLTDGFIYLEEDGNRRVCRLKDNPKLEALLDVVQGTGRKIIVFYEFEECGQIIQEALQKEEIAFAHIKGGLSLEERQAQEAKFRDDVQVILVQIQAGSEGWDGSAAGIVVFYDIVASPKIRKQCIGRMVRSGQQQKTIVYELIMKNTVNEATKASQKSRKSEIASIMEYLQGRKSK